MKNGKMLFQSTVRPTLSHWKTLFQSTAVRALSNRKTLFQSTAVRALSNRKTLFQSTAGLTHPGPATRLIGIALLLCALALPAKADWAYIGKSQMISYADAIAVVNIPKVDELERPVGSHASYERYHQKASANVEQVLKGKLGKTVDIYGGINLKGFKACVPDVILKPGRYLVFLHNARNEQGFPALAPDLWTIVNADLGFRPIVDNKVAWFKEEVDGPNGRTPVALSAVLSELKENAPGTGTPTPTHPH